MHASSPEERKERGALFRDFLESPVSRTCFDVQETALVQSLKDATDEASAMKVWARLRALLDVKADAMAVVEDGKLAAQEMERKADREPASTPLLKS